MTMESCAIGPCELAPTRSKHGEQTNQEAGTAHARKLIFHGDGRWQDPFLTLKLLKLRLSGSILFNT